MKKVILVAAILGIGIASVKAGTYLRKPNTFTANTYFVTGTTSDDPVVLSKFKESSGIAVFNGSSLTVNGTSLTKANKATLANGSTCSVTYKGTSANQVAVITLTRFLLPPLKTAGGPQANGNLLLTLPAGAQILPGAALNTLKLFAANGAVAIKSNGDVLGLGSVKAGGEVDNLAGTATFINILTGQQVQPNGRTLNAIGTTAYGTATSGTKTIYLNHANGFPAVTNATVYVNGTIAIPITNLY